MCAVWMWEFRQNSEGTQFFRMELGSRTEPYVPLVVADFFNSNSKVFYFM